MDAQDGKVTFFSKFISFNINFIDSNNPPNQPASDIRDYARQLSERRRLEEEKRKEDKFLRRSLRQSEKLRALANAKKVLKDFKESTDEIRRTESVDGNNIYYNLFWLSLLDASFAFEKINYEEFILQLRDKLRKLEAEHGETSDIDDLDDREWEWLANKVSKSSVLQAFRLHDTIASALEETRAKMGDKPMKEWSVGPYGIRSLDEVLDELRQIPRSERSSDMTELYKLLHKPQLVVGINDQMFNQILFLLNRRLLHLMMTSRESGQRCQRSIDRKMSRYLTTIPSREQFIQVPLKAVIKF